MAFREDLEGEKPKIFDKEIKKEIKKKTESISGVTGKIKNSDNPTDPKEVKGNQFYTSTMPTLASSSPYSLCFLNEDFRNNLSQEIMVGIKWENKCFNTETGFSGATKLYMPSG